MTVAQILDVTTERLAAAGVPSPRVDAQWLLEAVTGWTRARLMLERHARLEPDVLVRLEAMVSRRETREPLQWIIGSAGFYGLNLRVRPGVLIPRPETERLVEIVLHRLQALSTTAPSLVDIGTGTGAIALAVKHERPDANVFATDLSWDAVRLSLENARNLNLEITVQHGDLLANLEPGWDVIVSNPPYLPESDARHLEPEVQRDPSGALFSGVDGLEIARRIVDAARDTLNPGGFLALELDPRNVFVLQTELLRSDNTVWDEVLVHRDLAGRDRFLIATRARPENAVNSSR